MYGILQCIYSYPTNKSKCALDGYPSKSNIVMEFCYVFIYTQLINSSLLWMSKECRWIWQKISRFFMEVDLVVCSTGFCLFSKECTRIQQKIQRLNKMSRFSMEVGLVVCSTGVVPFHQGVYRDQVESFRIEKHVEVLNFYLYFQI